MRKHYLSIVYVVFALAALVATGGAPIPWSGTGGGTGILNALAFFGF